MARAHMLVQRSNGLLVMASFITSWPTQGRPIGRAIFVACGLRAKGAMVPEGVVAGYFSSQLDCLCNSAPLDKGSSDGGNNVDGNLIQITDVFIASQAGKYTLVYHALQAFLWVL